MLSARHTSANTVQSFCYINTIKAIFILLSVIDIISIGIHWLHAPNSRTAMAHYNRLALRVAVTVIRTKTLLIELTT